MFLPVSSDWFSVRDMERISAGTGAFVKWETGMSLYAVNPELQATSNAFKRIQPVIPVFFLD